MTQSNRRWVPEFLLLAALWGSSFLFMRLAVGEFGALPTAGMRVAIAALVLLPLLLWKRQFKVLLLHWKPLLLVGLLNSALPFVCFAFALQSISTGLSSVLNATGPLFGALVAWAWLGERPGVSRGLGLSVGFFGVALLAWDSASFKPDAAGLASGWAVLACLVATFSYGLAANFAKRHLAGLPSIVTATGSQLAAALLLVAPTVNYWPAQTPGAMAWLGVTAVGVLCTGVAYILYFRLIESVGPARSLAVTFVVPVFAMSYGVLLLHERVSAWMLLCAFVIVCGTSLSTGLVRLSRK